ncbi:hypothetical protein L1D14_25595 [Vibrio tubiashii]|uniref:hypothetical protein n=1 Tax=Vibrio tubiashii TaxID=29498 RepID=UPI001EFCD350|nr:hypothetical protein [Vibrio tubiashii]MCG9579586.1 hypothetical protein [Vibrio tubiashii]
MFTAIRESELYEQRLKKDMMFMLMANHPNGSVLQPQHILKLDVLGRSPSAELVEQTIRPVMEDIKERQVKFEVEKKRKATEAEEAAERTFDAQQQQNKKINLLY